MEQKAVKQAGDAGVWNRKQLNRQEMQVYGTGNS